MTHDLVYHGAVQHPYVALFLHGGYLAAVVGLRALTTRVATPVVSVTLTGICYYGGQAFLEETVLKLPHSRGTATMVPQIII